MRSAISATSFSLWLMKMTDLPCAREAADDLEQLPASCGVSTAVGSSSDEDVRVAVERLQDLDALLLPDGDVLDARRGSTASPNRSESSRTRSLGGAEVEKHAAVRRLRGEHDVLGDRHHRDEHEVLVHHPDARVDRRASASRAGPACP